jgi:transcriptional regulator GlxA family with amidase domain
MRISPKKYITSKRLLAAQQLLRAGERPTTVYLKCGFSTYPAFYKRYVEFFGYAPSDEREQGTTPIRT